MTGLLLGRAGVIGWPVCGWGGGFGWWLVVGALAWLPGLWVGGLNVVGWPVCDFVRGRVFN